ncbi:MAG: hypothetical protein DWH81_02335 [Planctomycetota bacterium]|nr:MAG: hypothetical protein DWH81_02335 [Planctomycetota bacterium]
MRLTFVAATLVGLGLFQADTKKHSVNIGFDLRSQLYITSSTLNENGSDKWDPGVKIPKDINLIVIKATEKLSTIVDNAKEWECFEIALRRHELSNLWYWAVAFYEDTPMAFAFGNPPLVVIGVHLDGQAFDVTKHKNKKK